jgi:biotin operon repressor
MSAEAMGWTFRHSPYKGAAFAVHMAVADSVNDQHGNDLWLTQPRIADKARVSRDAVNKAMKRLVADGFLELLEDNQRRGRANRYRFVFPEVEVAYESRFVPKSAEGVVTDDTLPGGDPGGGAAADDTLVDADDKVQAEGVSSQTTGVQSETTPGVVTDDTEPKRTQGEPNEGSATPRLAATGRGDEPPVTVQIGDGQIQVDPSDGSTSFDDGLWPAYPRHPATNALGGGGNRRKSKDRWVKLSTAQRRAALERLPWFVAHYAAAGTQPPYLEKWISERRWEDFDRPPDQGRDGLSDVAIALAEACGIDLDGVSGPGRHELVASASAIEASGGDDGMVGTVVKAWRKEWQSIRPTPTSVARHWHKFASGLTHRTTGPLCGRCGQPKAGHDQPTCDLLAGAA